LAALLEVRDLRKQFGSGENKVEALKSIHFSLQKGEFVAIMGSSGSGKSTLMHILGGMERPTSGNILVDGEEVNKTLFNEPKATIFRREKIGFVFQSYNLLAALTAEENVALPLILSGIRKREIINATEEMLQFVGLYERRKHRPSQLSGGQQQRVAIARALVHRPPILLADEPTGNLDALTTIGILQLFSTMQLKFNQSILLVTHDPSVAAHASRVIFFQDGTIEQEWVNDLEKPIHERSNNILDQLRSSGGKRDDF
jgi:putative ABC transport system ATP-binding protein